MEMSRQFEVTDQFDISFNLFDFEMVTLRGPEYVCLRLSNVGVGGIEADWLPSYDGANGKGGNRERYVCATNTAYSNDNDDTLLSVKKDILIDTSVKTDTPVVTVVTDEKTGDAAAHITADSKTLATLQNEAITNAATDDSSAGTTTGSKTITIPSNNIKFDSDSGKSVSTGPTLI